MAKIGTVSLAVEVPEFPMTSIDGGGILTVDGLPNDGSLILARLINGGVEFASGTARLAQFTGESSTNYPVDVTTNPPGSAYPPAGWVWVSRA